MASKSDLEEKLRLVREATEAIVLHYLQLDDEGNVISGPGTALKHLPKNHPDRIRLENDELHEFVTCAYGCNIPRKVITPGHRAPFDFIADLFFERVKNALGFANRSGGKTMGVAILNHLDMLFKPHCEIASAGAVLDQANKCYRYFTEFCESTWFKKHSANFEKVTKRPFLEKNIQSYTKFGNGAILEIITGTDKGLRGPHPNKARFDEIDIMEWPTLQTGLSMAISDDEHHIRGQNVFTSTRQKSHGSMQKLLDEAVTRGIEVYQWDIWEAVSKCKRRCVNDPIQGSCPIYTFCKGRAHHCDGFYAIDDFIDRVRLLDRIAFETEWENKRPSKEKLVYHMFDNSKHIMTPRRLQQLFGHQYPPRHWHRTSAIDFGSSPGHPFVYTKLCQLPNNAWLVFFEHHAEQRLLRDHASAIKSSPYYSGSDYCFADWDAQDRLELREYGVGTKQAVKDVSPGIDYVSSLLAGFPPREEPMLYVWYECSLAIKEFGLYQWPVKSNGEIDRSGKPEKKNDNSMDTVRYALYSNKSRIGPGYRTRSANI